jgi:hypothetical protein
VLQLEQLDRPWPILILHNLFATTRVRDFGSRAPGRNPEGAALRPQPAATGRLWKSNGARPGSGGPRLQAIHTRVEDRPLARISDD